MSGNGNSRTHHGPEGHFRGVFAIPPTPFDEIGNIDEASLRQCIDFCINADTHGIVGLVNASETIALTDAERLRVTEILVDQAANRVPVPPGLLTQLFKELPGVDFLKEETLLGPRVMTTVRQSADSALRGVMAARVAASFSKNIVAVHAAPCRRARL